MTALPEVPEGLELNPVGNDDMGMFRSIFGEPKPRTKNQIVEALMELNVDITDVYEIAISDSTSEPTDSIWHGWTAEIRSDGDENFGDESWISTGGWPSREALVTDLKEIGFRENVMVDEES